MEIVPPVVRDKITETLTLPKPAIQEIDRSAQLADLERQRKKIERHAEDDIYTPDEAKARMDEVRRQIEEIERGETENNKRVIAQDVFYSTLSGLHDLPLIEWICGEDPEIVNPIMIRLIESILIAPDHNVTVRLRSG